MRMLEMARNNDIDLIADARAEAGRLSSSSFQTQDEGVPSIPGYDLIAEIGRGGQGIVYEAVQSATGRRVAVKLMRDGPAAGSERRLRFEREIHLLTRLEHPALVTVHDSGEVAGRFFLVMEFVEGTPIDEYVLGGALDRRETLALFTRVCDAVHAAHQRGVMHRDLKPANILVDETGLPHVLDFGLAKLTRDADDATAVTCEGRMLGTMAWVSPEQASGRADDVDVRTDVYSLGVVLYELLTGRLPYETSGSIHEALDNIARAAPIPPSHFERSLRGDIETIALKCLAKEPARRYGTVADVAADVRRHLAGEAIEARRDSPLYVLGRTMLKYRVPMSVGVACMIGGFTFGAVMAGMYQQEARQHQEAAQQVEQLRDELEQLKAQLARPESWRTTMSSAVKLNELEPEEGLNLIQMAWAEASGDSYARQQMLKAAFVARHPLLVRVMDLGMRDPSPEVQEWAITYLRQTALRDFALSFREYEAWYAKSKDLTLEEIVRRGVEEMAETLQATHAGERAKLFVRDGRGAMLASSPAAAAIAAEYDIHELIIPALEPSAGRDVIRTISDTLAEMSLGEPFVRARILPLLDSENHDIANAAIEIVASQKAAYAVDTLVELLTERYYSTDQAAIALHDVADALGEIGDPRVIPIMIALIDGDDTYRTIYGIGYAGLADLTGVRYDESHDGEWWRQWWEDNRARYPGLDDAEIPELKPKQGAESNPQRSAKPRTDRRVAPVDQQPLEPETPEQSLLAGGTPEMRYFLYGPKSHQIDGAHPLLLVLPGGDGSANFKPFVSNIWRQTSPPDMLVAQLVAPRWSPDQFDSVVWPTIGTAWEDAEFTTEQFIETVVDDIDARYDVDRSRVWILAWSSGGPAAYASLMDGPATGAFIAMSVFKGDQLGDLSRVAGKDVYILHSPTDFIPMQFPEAARDKLGENGATTKLQTYSGGHGWHGDVFGMIREGLVWLQQHAGD